MIPRRTLRAARLRDEFDVLEKVGVMRAFGQVFQAIAEGQQVKRPAAPGKFAGQVVDDQPVTQVERIGRAAGDNEDAFHQVSAGNRPPGKEATRRGEG